MSVPTIAFLGAFLLSGATVAEEPAPVRALDFGGFLGWVRARNPDLAGQRMEEKIRAAAVETAGSLPDPQVIVSLDSLQIPQPHAPTVVSVRLSQTFELGGKRSSRIAAAEAERKATRAMRGLDRSSPALNCSRKQGGLFRTAAPLSRFAHPLIAGRAQHGIPRPRKRVELLVPTPAFPLC